MAPFWPRPLRAPNIVPEYIKGDLERYGQAVGIIFCATLCVACLLAVLVQAKVCKRWKFRYPVHMRSLLPYHFTAQNVPCWIESTNITDSRNFGENSNKLPSHDSFHQRPSCHNATVLHNFSHAPPQHPTSASSTWNSFSISGQCAPSPSFQSTQPHIPSSRFNRWLQALHPRLRYQTTVYTHTPNTHDINDNPSRGSGSSNDNSNDHNKTGNIFSSNTPNIDTPTSQGTPVPNLITGARLMNDHQICSSRLHRPSPLGLTIQRKFNSLSLTRPVYSISTNPKRAKANHGISRSDVSRSLTAQTKSTLCRIPLTNKTIKIPYITIRLRRARSVPSRVSSRLTVQPRLFRDISYRFGADTRFEAAMTDPHVVSLSDVLERLNVDRTLRPAWLSSGLRDPSTNSHHLRRTSQLTHNNRIIKSKYRLTRSHVRSKNVYRHAKTQTNASCDAAFHRLTSDIEEPVAAVLRDVNPSTLVNVSLVQPYPTFPRALGRRCINSTHYVSLTLSDASGQAYSVQCCPPVKPLSLSSMSNVNQALGKLTTHTRNNGKSWPLNPPQTAPFRSPSSNLNLQNLSILRKWNSEQTLKTFPSPINFHTSSPNRLHNENIMTSPGKPTGPVTDMFMSCDSRIMEMT